MHRTPLYDKLTASGAHMGEFCGAETALSFGDPRAEFEALRSGCGVADLGWRTFFKVSGADRTRWLNGMVSNNIRDLPPGRGNYNFVLNQQGRIQGDLYVFNCGDYFLADTERCQLENLLKLLGKYIIMDKVQLEDISYKLAALAVEGAKAAQVLSQVGLEYHHLDALQMRDIVWLRASVLLIPRPSHTWGFEIWAEPKIINMLWEALTQAGATPVGVEALEMMRVASGVPRYGVDIRDRDLPQETGQMRALSFSKGCYIGQEIVERIRSRGNVHRTLAGFVAEGQVPKPGAKVQAQGKDVGEITSALAVPARNGDRLLALGYVRREAAAPGASVVVEGASARISPLPFPETS